MTFGGGFYGLVALLTFVVIELTQITQFWLGVESWGDITALFSISAIVAMFVDSIVNMIKAAVWFSYWPDVLSSKNFLVCILMAYIGYRIGAKLARIYIIERNRKEAENEKSAQ